MPPKKRKAAQMEDKSPNAKKEKRLCGMSKHLLREPHKRIQDAGMLQFARRMNPELSTRTLICGKCFDKLNSVYNKKYSRAVQLKNKQRAGGATSISDVSSSQRTDLQISSSSSSTNLLLGPGSFSSSSSSESNATGINTVVVQKTPQAQHPTATDDDDDEPLLSLNAVNGTRLPNIQPIPSRRQFVHANKHIMDIYLAGTTGG